MESSEKRALAKCEELERELKRSPDFQLYLLTQSRSDRARMERLLIEIPMFALWLTLHRSERTVRGQLDGEVHETAQMPAATVSQSTGTTETQPTVVGF